jgi:uncharacterized protein (TIGR02300 family)
MPKPEWGVKRTCASCGARFYDLMNDPILCPDCGATFVIETAKAARRRSAAPDKPKPVDAEDAELVEDDADVLDSDDDDDDGVAVEGAAGSGDDDEDDSLTPDDSVLLEDDSDDEDLSEFGDNSDDDDRR